MPRLEPRLARRLQVVLGAAVALLIFALMALSIADTQPWQGTGTQDNVTAANDQATLVDAMFGPQVITLEVLGILLTAAMIGALVIARPMDGPDDDANYTVPTPAQVAESDDASDPKAHALRNPGVQK